MTARTITIGLLTLLTAACARRREVTVERGDERAPDDVVFVEVINDNYYDARVHLVYVSGAPHALGTVPGNQRSTLHKVPWQPQPLFFEVSLVVPGDETYRSDRVDASPGDVIQIRVPHNLHASGFFRRVSR